MPMAILCLQLKYNSRMRTTVYLPLEVFQREYAGKLALALKLVDAGFKVIIGHVHFVRDYALDSSSPGIYYDIKGQSLANQRYLEYLKNAGFRIVLQDEEAGINYVEYADFALLRPEVRNLDLFDVIFAYGQKDFEYLVKHNFNSRILLTGSPRTSLWGDLGANFYSDLVDQYKHEFGEYILFVSNNTFQNGFINRRRAMALKAASGYKKTYSKAERKRKTWEIESANVNFKVIDNLLEKTNLNIVIRPHPVEHSGTWSERFAGVRRIFVKDEGAITPLILGAKFLIHNSSTVGLESIALGIPTFTLSRLVHAQGFKFLSDELANKIGFVDNFSRILDSHNESLADLSLLHNAITNLGDVKAIDNQVEIISQIAHGIKGTSLNRTPFIDESSNLIRRAIRRLIYGKNEFAMLDKVKRPEITLQNINDDVENFKSIFGIRSSINIVKLNRSTFELDSLIS